MPQFDLRRPSVLRSLSEGHPRVPLRPLLGCAAVAALAAAATLTARAVGLVHPELAQAAAPAPHALPPPGPRRTTIEVLRGETLQSAIARAGVSPEEAAAAVAALSPAFDIAHFRAGLDLEALVAPARDPRTSDRLMKLSFGTGPVSSLTLNRAPEGGFTLDEHREDIRDDTAVAQGEVKGSLYQSALAAGADSRLTGEVVKLFAKKLDFARDFHPGDGFRMVFDRQVAESGKVVSTGDLLFAEIGAKGKTTRFYRFEQDGKAQYFDEQGKNTQGFLLKTPIDGARITSGFGMRFHPILAYTRMHQGIDFGAPRGTPVYAAGDGTVAEIKRTGGYGNWLEIRHTGGWATGYGHLSGYARGLRAGQHVAQGQLVAYVGSTGLSTGPHLHYELMQNGRKLDPRSAKAPQGTVLEGRERAAFLLAKARVDDLLAQAAPTPAEPTPMQTARLALRGSQTRLR